MDTDVIRSAFVENEIEVVEGRSGEPARLVGYAAVFNQETVINSPDGPFRERIMPTAFNDAIERDDVIAAVNHDEKMVLGRARKGTLKLSVDARGLRYEVALPNTSLGRDTLENVRSGNYAGSSFKFALSRDGFRVQPPRNVDDMPLVMIDRVKSLKDVGPVTFPAYEGTSVSVRSLGAMVSEAIRTQIAEGLVAAAVSVRNRMAARIAIERARTWA